MSPTNAGLIYCLSFVTLEAFQAVYLGSVFQQANSFLVGSLVFGISVVGCTMATAIVRPAELLASLRAWGIVVALNVFASLAWIMYFFAIQLIEPAVVFTIFSGMVPLGTVIAARLGLPEALSAKRRFANAGHWLIGLSILLLAAITALGLSGFVRGGWSIGLLGAMLAAFSGGFTALVILFSVRLNRHGVGILAQFGLWFILYTVLAVAAFPLGLDDKGRPLPAADLAWIVMIGLLVIAFPLYLVQKAIPLLHPSVIAAITALGPASVFLMQLSEGRVEYSAATLAGLTVYMVDALLTVFGTTRFQEGSLLGGRK